jgi:hypothetical protein
MAAGGDKGSARTISFRFIFCKVPYLPWFGRNTMSAQGAEWAYFKH